MTFEFLAALWLRTYKNKVNFSQHKNSCYYTNHLDRYIGGTDVDQTKLANIDALLGVLTDRNPNTGRPAPRQTLADIRSTVNHVFEYGMDLELITRNPARRREVSRYASRRYRRTLTATEQSLVISTPYRVRVGALMMMPIGLRQGELIPLIWDDISLDTLRTSVIESAESRNSNRLIIKSGTKTSWSRVVDTTLDLMLEL